MRHITNRQALFMLLFKPTFVIFMDYLSICYVGSLLEAVLSSLLALRVMQMAR
jgi:hypothetical protein